MKVDSAEILFQPFLRKAIVSSSDTGKYVHSLTLSIQHFLCRPRRRPSLEDALKDGFGEAVVACDMSEPCKFLSLYICQKRFMWTHKEVDLAPRPVSSLVLQVGDAEKFSRALGFENLGPFFQSQQTESLFHSHTEKLK